MLIPRFLDLARIGVMNLFFLEPDILESAQVHNSSAAKNPSRISLIWSGEAIGSKGKLSL